MRPLSRLLRMLLAIVPDRVLSDAGFLDSTRIARESHAPRFTDGRERARFQLRDLIGRVSEEMLKNAHILDLQRASLIDDELRRLLCAVTDGTIRDTDRCRKILHDYEVAHEAQKEVMSADRSRLIYAQHAFRVGWGGTNCD